MSLDYYHVVFKGRIPGPFVYSFPGSLSNFVRVLAPLRGKVLVGMVVYKLREVEVKKINFSVKKIECVNEIFPAISDSDFKFASWLARFYFAFLGDALALFVSFTKSKPPHELIADEDPSSWSVNSTAEKNPDKNTDDLTANFSFSLDEKETELLTSDVSLTHQQNVVAQQLGEHFAIKFQADEGGLKVKRGIVRVSAKASNQVALLEGVTGSGKSYVYAALAKACLQNSKSVLLLVPEISIAIASLELLENYIPAKMLYVFHSKQTKKKKAALRKAISSNAPVLVLGTRSTLFIPNLNNVGLVIVDEEHEDGYKNNYAPRYHVRQAVQFFCKSRDACLLFGSATPSLETMQFAREGKMLHCKLQSRHNPAPEAEVHMLAVRRERLGGDDETSLLRKETLDAINKFVSAGRGVMVFVNRRGFSSVLACKSCGHFPLCPSCDVSLTFYKQKSILRCHYCNFVRKIHLQGATPCASCKKKSGYVFYKGGTEKISDFLKVQLPQISIERFDSEAVSTGKKIDKILKAFYSGEINVLVGTQMLAKGHNFPLAGLMVMMRVESVLALPDFRASERLYRTIVQAKGRVGRSETRVAKVIMETTHAEDKTVRCAVLGLQDRFYTEQLQFRKLFFYPPFSRLVKFVVRSSDENKAHNVATQLRAGLLQVFVEGIEEGWAVVLDAVPCFFTRLQGSYRFQVLVKVERGKNWQSAMNSLQVSTSGLFFAKPGSVVEIDVDPIDLF